MFSLSGVLFILFAIFANIYSFQTVWEHKQFTKFKFVKNFKYYESLEFTTFSVTGSSLRPCIHFGE